MPERCLVFLATHPMIKDLILVYDIHKTNPTLECGHQSFWKKNNFLFIFFRLHEHLKIT